MISANEVRLEKGKSYHYYYDTHTGEEIQYYGGGDPLNLDLRSGEDAYCGRNLILDLSGFIMKMQIITLVKD